MKAEERIAELISEMMKRGEYIAPLILVSYDIFKELQENSLSSLRINQYASGPTGLSEFAQFYTAWGPMTIQVAIDRYNHISINGRTLEDIIIEDILLKDD